jgi:hypothetical protein
MLTAQRPDDMGDLVTQIARALVDIPADVKVEEVEKEESTALRLHVAPTDVGKVIGKQGRTARSIRTILGAVSMKHHHRYSLDSLEEDKHAPEEEHASAASTA